MGNTEQEQAEAMKRYIREVVIPEYARNFNKGLSAEDIKFYGKIHFSRDRSNNELNMHCHLIVSRKDQSNKKKLSPLTNHKNTKKGTVKGCLLYTSSFSLSLFLAIFLQRQPVCFLASLFSFIPQRQFVFFADCLLSIIPSSLLSCFLERLQS